MTGSYVRGCAIHHTFNRAVTVHGVSGLLVEHNVANDVMGHAFFIEDGIETGNTIQYNLGVAVRTSSTLLITDVTPATFWVTNPNNTSKYGSYTDTVVINAIYFYACDRSLPCDSPVNSCFICFQSVTMRQPAAVIMDIGTICLPTRGVPRSPPLSAQAMHH